VLDWEPLLVVVCPGIGTAYVHMIRESDRGGESVAIALEFIVSLLLI
jgi:hypothetical protein